MAQYRTVNTRFWDDPYISELTPAEKLVFLYLITNPLTNIAGIYEIQMKRMALDVGIEKPALDGILTKLGDDGKIVYKNGWMAVLNFPKHQANNPATIQGIIRTLSELPAEILASLLESGYSLPSAWDDTGIMNRINTYRIEKQTRSLQTVTDSSESGIPNLTKPNYTKPNLTAAGQSVSDSLPPGFGSVGKNKFLVLNAEELDRLNKEFPEINIDREYLEAQHSASIRGELVEKPFAFMRSRLAKIRISNKMSL